MTQIRLVQDMLYFEVLRDKDNIKFNDISKGKASQNQVVILSILS